MGIKIFPIIETFEPRDDYKTRLLNPLIISYLAPLVHSRLNMSCLIKFTLLSLFAITCAQNDTSLESYSCTWSRGGSCYSLVNTVLSFWEALSYCNTVHRGSLVAINSKEEDDFLRARLLDLYGYEEGNFFS